MLENRCCSTGENKKVVVIEYLYLDLNTCESSVRTEKVLESVVDELRHAFKIAGYDLEYHKVLIETGRKKLAKEIIIKHSINYAKMINWLISNENKNIENIYAENSDIEFIY